MAKRFNNGNRENWLGWWPLLHKSLQETTRGPAKAKATKARASEAENIKEGGKRKRIKQESSGVEIKLDADQTDEEIKTDSSPEDGDQTVAPPSKRAKIPKKAKAKTHAATIKDEDEDEGADIDG
ncbi:MAG: hypothetical protein HETSPECPRED_006647 [Heterodermia speciosa]|uniref:Uncharacterized protein n=1 Tax=Heterodermia speciosa TaxID=116794 RepID=A0A8H3FTT6_9LECA|nr:MAG: hypothetical protein HETSPECPRED_006647 [Heterodermia speciosa]